MTRFKKVLIFTVILVISLLVGYILGNYIPTDILKPNYVGDTITLSDYYKLLVSIVSASMTFLALVIALFKDDIREMWKRPRLSFSLPDNHTIEDTYSYLDSESGSETIRAKKYVSRVLIKNSGNLPALHCEMYLVSLEFVPKSASLTQNIECSSAPLEWNGIGATPIIISPGGSKMVNIVEITAPEKVSTPDSAKTNKNPQLIIGTIPNHEDHDKGDWKAKFSLFAQNHSEVVSIEVHINWSGLWKNRLADFNSQYKIESK
jgi:hypothetical protein